ncbi:MAG: radical SAM protein [Chloroflexota bacterium]|nr:radical SAM protein [Chloroflexota bacterium]
MTDCQPAYLKILKNGDLEKRVYEAKSHLKACDVCPLQCGVNRTVGELGICKIGKKVQVSSYFAHLGEERPISGSRGSGTIFFSRCNLRCVYCQNADISQLSFGKEYDAEELAGIMLSLQRVGCHNINLVSPSHVVPQILEAVHIAARRGLSLPLVYNTGGYDSLEMLFLLDGVVDIYMPDMKYGEEPTARKYSIIKNYPIINQKAILEMQRQVGDLIMDQDGIAMHGLLVRHLVLPNDLAGSAAVLRFLAEKVSKNVYLNIMAQYHPAFKAKSFPELNRRISAREYKQVIDLARELRLTRLD